jgi:AraC-like DNA-binding protein
VWLLFSRLPVHDEQGQIVGVVANSRRMDGSVHDERYARLAVAIHHISEHYDWPLSLPDLARLAGISASQLDRDFVRLLGMSPRDFLHKVRIDEACHLLRGGAGVSQVAYACGYSDHSAFSRRFRLETGTSPRAWRRGLAVAGAATADEA